MQLRWSEEAASDLERITNYLFEETPQHAPKEHPLLQGNKL
jgi:plasmid stabilization system protein ParE